MFVRAVLCCFMPVPCVGVRPEGCGDGMVGEDGGWGEGVCSVIVACPGWRHNPLPEIRLFKYIENFTTRKGKFSVKMIIFIFLLKT